MTIALVGNRLMRRQAAPRRAAWLKVALVLVVATPLIYLVPPPRVTVAVATALTGSSEPFATTAIGPEIPSTPDSDWSTSILLVLLYAGGGLALIARLSFGLALLTRWTAGARPMVEPLWSAAADRVGLPNHVRLLECDRVEAPLSWGLVSPVILIDRRSLANADNAAMILAHESAHVRHLDWPALIAARLVVATLWFNPLAWLFERALIQCCEETADVAALRHGSAADYARLLLDSARPTEPIGAAATGLTGNALRDRILAVLAGPSLVQQYPARSTVQAGIAIGLICCWSAGIRVESIAADAGSASYAPQSAVSRPMPRIRPSATTGPSLPSHASAMIDQWYPVRTTHDRTLVGEHARRSNDAVKHEPDAEVTLPQDIVQQSVDPSDEEWRRVRASHREQWRSTRAEMRVVARAQRALSREAVRARRGEARRIPDVSG